MAVDTPARIIVLGAGPVGLEAALYGRFLGYDVDIYERGRVGQSLRDAGNEPLPWPFKECVTSLACAALRAQDALWKPPAGDTVLTALQLVTTFLVPLSQSDLLADQVHEEIEVLAVTRQQPAAPVEPGDKQPNDEESEDEDEDGEPLRIVLRDGHGREHFAIADVVLDCTGVNAQVVEGESTPDNLFRRTLMPDVPRVAGGGVVNPAENFYVLGAKGFSSPSDFTLAAGHDQIRALFAILGDRADLDLYRSIGP